MTIRRIQSAIEVAAVVPAPTSAGVRPQDSGVPSRGANTRRNPPHSRHHHTRGALLFAAAFLRSVRGFNRKLGRDFVVEVRG